MMAKNTLPSYQPALTAPRRAVGRVVREGCLNWSRPFVCDYVRSQSQKVNRRWGVLAYRMSQSKHAMRNCCCDEERVFVGGGGCGCHCCFYEAMRKDDFDLAM